MTAQIISLTADEKILIHLHENPIVDVNDENVMMNTQAGISTSTRIQRKHLSRNLRSLSEQSLLLEDSIRPLGARQKRKSYHLTELGHKKAGELVDSLCSTNVLQDGVEKKISDYTSSASMLTILSWIDADLNIFPGQPMHGVDEKGDLLESPDTKSATERLLRNILKKVWRDGILSQDEYQILHEVVVFLDADPSLVSKLTDEILEQRLQEMNDVHVIYENIVESIGDAGEAVDHGSPIMSALRQVLGVESKTKEKVKTEKDYTYVFENFDAIMHPYVEAVLTATNDGTISPDELAILSTLRSSLGISDNVHEAILEAIWD